MKMTEGKALGLVFLGMAIVFLGAVAVLAALGAGNDPVVLMALIVMIAGVQALGAVIRHYGPQRRKQPR